MGIVMPLQAKLNVFKPDFKGGKGPYFAPPEFDPTMERATAELVASGQAERALKAATSRRNLTSMIRMANLCRLSNC
jgi:hypothetical protein